MKRLFLTLCIIAVGVLLGRDISLAAPAVKTWIDARRAPDLVKAYLASHKVHKLQIGAGFVNLPGWLNTDIEPGPDQVFLDATKRFPIPDGTIHYIFAEQLIEHLRYEDGLTMLRECYRVLAPGGKIRLTTPNLLKLIQLFEQQKTDQMQRYITEKVKSDEWPESRRPETMILNLQLRSFGHQFVYDPALLSDSMAQAGFQAIGEFAAGESDDTELRGIDFRKNSPFWRDMNDYESMALQAVRR